MLKKALAVILLSFLGFAETDSVNRFQKQAVESAQEAAGASLDLAAADYLVGKFKYRGLDSLGKPILPVWFPEFYPTAQQMSPTSKIIPRIRNFQAAASNSTFLVPKYEITKTKVGENCVSVQPAQLSPPLVAPTDCLEWVKTYALDSSRLGSLEINPIGQNEQGAFVGVVDMSRMSESQKSQYFRGETVVPSSGEITSKKVFFKKYISDYPENPAKLKALEVQVGATLLQIPVDSNGSFPPEPGCRVQLSNAARNDFQPGENISFDVFANSITTYAEASADNFKNIQPLALPPEQSVGLIGTFTKLGTFSVQVPQSPYPGTPANADGSLVNWLIQARVHGVGQIAGSIECVSANVKVTKPLPPACMISASPMNLLKGETTVLTLRCTNQVTSASIDGKSVVLDALKVGKLEYVRKTDDASEIVNGKVMGPGGEITPQVVLGKTCPFNDPNYSAAVWPNGSLLNLFSRNWKVQQLTNQTYFLSYDLPANGRMLDDFGHVWRTPRACGSNNFCMRSLQVTQQNTGYAAAMTLDGVKWYTALGGNAYDVEIGPKESADCKVLKTAVRTGGCFASNTWLQMADGQEKLVSEITENDLIFNPHYQTGVRVKKVVKGPEKKSLYEVQLGKNSIQVTEDHPFLTQRGWVQALALKTGDQLMGEGPGKRVTRVEKLKYQGPQDVWNFELDTEDPLAHVVVANGIPTGDLVTQQELKKGKRILP